FMICSLDVLEKRGSCNRCGQMRRVEKALLTHVAANRRVHYGRGGRSVRVCGCWVCGASVTDRSVLSAWRSLGKVAGMKAINPSPDCPSRSVGCPDPKVIESRASKARTERAIPFMKLR